MSRWVLVGAVNYLSLGVYWVDPIGAALCGRGELLIERDE